jgi:hypothetical protein
VTRLRRAKSVRAVPEQVIRMTSGVLSARWALIVAAPGVWARTTEERRLRWPADSP